MRLTSRLIGFKGLTGLAALAAAATALMMLAAAPAKADFIDGHAHDFQSRISGFPGTYIGLDQKGKKKLKRLNVVALVACGKSGIGGPIPLPTVKGTFKVKYGKGGKTGKFSGKRVIRSGGTNFGNITLKGTRKGRKLKGTVSIAVRIPGLGRCVSGEMTWSTKKGRKVSVPMS